MRQTGQSSEEVFLQEEIDNALGIVAGEKAVHEPMIEFVSKSVDERGKLLTNTQPGTC